MAERVRLHLRVEGIVQGVGFRPFVYAQATRLRLAGRVGNDVDGVFVEVEGDPSEVDAFTAALHSQAPPLARIDRVTTTEHPPDGAAGFAIVNSNAVGQRHALVSPDTATCADCLREMRDPADRRYRYPFINCTNCGPRFTIVRDVPYDRPLTTMAAFAMCEPCAAEYHDPADRRFHAQPTCCPDCGPRLRVVQTDGTAVDGDPIAVAAELLRAGKIVAVKGIGGYHLAVLASDEQAAATLRGRKHREDKPFAVMVSTVDDAGRLVDTGGAEDILTGRRRPIVLLPRKPGSAVAPSVAPGNRHLGVLLPYTPLHHLLLDAVSAPIVLTSGNISDEPIAYVDDEAAGRLADIADAILTHDRPIHMRADDSVVRPFHGRISVLRRSRGYAPEPLTLPRPASRPILGCGAELKNTFCLAKGAHAFVSQHIGDLENYETLRSYTEGIEHFSRLFEIEPRIVAHDLHPEYLSTKHAFALDDVELIGVQHHHAHIASCLADNGVDEPVIGVAFDGLGYGSDGTLWGGEFLRADLTGFERLGHLTPVAMPGAATAIKQPWRTAVSYLDAAFDGAPPESLDVLRRNDNWRDVQAVARSRIGAPLTSSAGRLFDAVSALIGLRDAVNYEGQAAIEFEQIADRDEQGAYPVGVQNGATLQIPGHELIRAAAEDVVNGVPSPVIAARFHNGVAAAIVDVCRRLRERTTLETVALSGGVFQNLLLLTTCVDRLSADGFRVLTHSRVPTNDGGISLGQVAVAAAQA